MITQFDALAESGDSACSLWTAIPMEQVVQEVYACSEPDTQHLMLAKLVGKVFESAQLPLRARLLEQLLRSVGLLSLIAVASGIFAKIRFRNRSPDVHLQIEDVQSVQSSDVVALVEHVLQTQGDVLRGLTQVLRDAPSTAEAGATAVLMAILGERQRSSVPDGTHAAPATRQFAAH